ncbi:methyltransferase domain-containing protein [Candidatus Woesearchaeota archaeon]|nr:methyltransferase domain-containing protein [Candidatus Woesearchaeota archaeon]
MGKAHRGECQLVECTFTITSLAWWCRPPAVVTTRSGRAAGVPALEMIRAMLLSSDRVEPRGAGQLRFSTEPVQINGQVQGGVMSMQNTYYDKISRGYDELYRTEQEKKMQEILKNLPPDFIPKEYSRLLDVGCGNGISTATWNCNCVGIDPSKELIALAKKNNAKNDVKQNRVFVEGAAEKIPFSDHVFDFVISVTAIHNFDNINKGIAEMKRAGKDRFIFSVLKKSPKLAFIEKEIRNEFNVVKEIDAGIDKVFFCKST